MKRQPRLSGHARTLRGMTQSRKTPSFLAGILATFAATTALMTTAQPAQAEDKRPCVSKREFYGARDFGIVIPAGHDWMSRVPPPTDNPIGRLKLEDKWDVRHRGVRVTDLLDSLGSSRISNPRLRIKMYRACDHPLSELRVYVGYHKDTNLVLWTMWWPSRVS